MMALPDENSLTYLDKCAESGDAVDPTKVQGMSREEILSHFYKSVQYRRKGDGWAYDFDVEALRGNKLIRDLVDAKTKKAFLVFASTKSRISLLPLKASTSKS